MGKKGLPEWMNSSLWSSSSSPKALFPLLGSPTGSSPDSRTIPDPRPMAPPPVVEPPSKSVTRVTAGDPISSKEEISRQSQLLAELSKKVINLGEVRKLASQGIPDGAGIRSTVWKLLLGYLPNDRGL